MAILGIDIGNSASTIATIKDGTIKVVLSDTSERSTPTLVTFLSDRRLFGNESYSQMSTRYQNTIRDIKKYVASDRTEVSDSDLLFQTHAGLFFSSPQKEDESGTTEVEKTAEAGFIVPLNDEIVRIDATNVIASFLCFLKRRAEKSEECTFTEVVVSVPPHFDMIHRQSIIEAVKVANLTLLRLINDNVAVALDYGIFRRTQLKEYDEDGAESKDAPTSSIVCFVSMGHSHFGATLASFSGKGLKILGESFAKDTGGRDVTQLLMQHCVNIFNQKISSADILQNKRSLVKLEEACEKAKKILSSNISTTISVDCLSGDSDFNSNISQDELMKICDNLIKKMEGSLNKLFSSSGVNPSAVSRVEVVGGASRMKIFKDVVKKFFNREISTTLNASESVARGCALNAALISSSYRVPDYSIEDICFRGIDISWVVDSSEGSTKKKVNLFSSENGLHFGRSKVLTFMRRGTFKLSLSDQESGKTIVVFLVECPDSSQDEEVKVKIQLDRNGIIGPPEAWIFSKENDISTLSATEEVQHDVTNPESSAQSHPVGPEKVKLVKIPLVVKSTFGSRIGALETGKSIEQEMVFLGRDMEVNQILEVSNTLEAMIYNIRSSISEGGDLIQFISFIESENLMKLVDEKASLLDHDTDSVVPLCTLRDSVEQLERAISVATKRRERFSLLSAETRKIGEVIERDLSKLDTMKSSIKDYEGSAFHTDVISNDSHQSSPIEVSLLQQLEQVSAEFKAERVLYEELKVNLRSLDCSDDSAISCVELEIIRMKELSAKNSSASGEVCDNISRALESARLNSQGSSSESVENLNDVGSPQNMDVDGNVESSTIE